MKQTEVLIAIQARSNSTRFPKKIFEHIGKNRALDHVINSALSTAKHIMRYRQTQDIRCQVAVLHPNDDTDIVKAFSSSGAILIGGDENDVLSRYVKAQEYTDADYVVRLTSDCPLMLDFVIAKHINCAVKNDLDYLSNVDEECRFVADGFDCEIISKKALQWLDRHASAASDREHVTTLIRSARPNTLKCGVVTMKIDTSHMKMSLDTPEDLDRIRTYYHDRDNKMAVARRLYGAHVYEL